jgi:putative DNA primase/helicase
VAYIDGEMHIGDIQERLRLLLDAAPGVDRKLASENLRFLSRQHQNPGTDFPLITDGGGADYLAWIRQEKQDLLILNNFSTLGEVTDENAAASFNAILQFLLGLKMQGVATMLVHHAGKSGDFRGSSKLAATFETIIKLEKLREGVEPGTAQFRVRYDKVRAGGPNKTVREIVAKLEHLEQFGEPPRVAWAYEAGDLPLFDDLKMRLEAGEFINQKEIADYCGKSKPMGKVYIDKGIQFGMWTEAEVGRSLWKGKQLRNLGKTQPPDRPDMGWKAEDLGAANDPPDQPVAL